MRAVLDIARHPEGRRKQREIAAAAGIPARSLTHVLATLVQGGYLTARAGPRGGYSLTRRPAQISLLEVIETVEGPMKTDACALRGGNCDWERSCEMHDAWSRAQAALLAKLGRTSFQDLLRRATASARNDRAR